MKIVMWIGGEANQKALANKIHNRFPITAIITETSTRKRHVTLTKILEKGIEKVFLPGIGQSWFSMLKFYEKSYPQYPPVPVSQVADINSQEAYDLIKSFEADVVLVSGTSMIKKKLLSIKPSIGILNLHTGLSPYIKGAPNCTNWCLSTGQFHLIGNTVMWIDEGIDSGNIVTTEFTGLTGFESLSEIHFKVMEHAHDLLLRSVASIQEGIIISVPQNQIAKGNTYYKKHWGIREKIKLTRNLKKFRRAFPDTERLRKNIIVVPLEMNVHDKKNIVHNL